MSYRSRVEAAVLTGTPPLRALWWALSAGRPKRLRRQARYPAVRPGQVA